MVRVPAAAAAALGPGRCVTCTDVQASYSYEPDQWHYFKQFCEPGVNSPRKSAAQVLRDEDCPSMIIPSRPRSHPWTPGVRLGQAELFLALQSSLIRNALQRKLCLPKREHSTQAKVLT
ncbi:choline transporter-like protein 2 [Amazona ochrocephala]